MTHESGGKEAGDLEWAVVEIGELATEMADLRRVLQLLVVVSGEVVDTGVSGRCCQMT